MVILLVLLLAGSALAASLLSEWNSAPAVTGPGAPVPRIASHAPSPSAIPPSKVPGASVSVAGYPYSCSSNTSCPFGIVDQAFGPQGYTYYSNTFLATTSWTNLSFQNLTTVGNGSGDPVILDQLNTVLNFTAGGTSYAYWIQDMASIDTGTNASWTPWFSYYCGTASGPPNTYPILFLDNIWNFTNLHNFSQKTGDGHGHLENDTHQHLVGGFAERVVPQSSSSTYTFYYDIADPRLPGNCFYVSRAAAETIRLEVVSSIQQVANATFGAWTWVPSVTFLYEDGATAGRFVAFDEFNFTFAWNPSTRQVSSAPGFTVSPQPVPAASWLYYDAENILGGDGAGATTYALSGAHLEMGLEYSNGHNLQTVPSAWDDGLDSAEKVTDLQLGLASSGGLPRASASYGKPTDAIVELYEENSLGHLDVQPVSTEVTSVFLGNGTQPRYSAVDQDGNLWVTDFGDGAVQVLQTATGRILANISVGKEPVGISFDAYSDLMYVANYGSGTVSVLDTIHRQVVATIPLGIGTTPYGVEYVPLLNNSSGIPSKIGVYADVFVTDPAHGSVVFVRSSTETVVGSASVGAGPMALAFDADRLNATNSGSTALYVTNSRSNNVSVLELRADGPPVVAGAIPVGRTPFDAMYADHRLVVTDAGSAEVSVIDTVTSRVTTTWVGNDPGCVAFSPTYDEFFVSMPASNTVRVLSANAGALVGVGIASYITVGLSPLGLTYDPGNGLLYVADSGSDRLSLVSGYAPALGRATPSTGPGSTGNDLAYDGANGDLYMTDTAANVIQVYSASNRSELTTIPVGVLPEEIAYDSYHSYLYVANEGSGTISIIDGSRNVVIATVGGQTNPWAVVYDSSNHWTYVTNVGCQRQGCPGNVTVLDGTRTVGNVSIAPDCYGIGYDPANGMVYVVSLANGSLQAISGTTVVDTVSVGDFPAGVAYDSENGLLYVTEAYDYAVETFRSGNGGRTTVPVGTVLLSNSSLPQSVLYDGQNQLVYVASYGGGVSVISSSTDAVIATIPVLDFGGEESLAIDPQTGVLYVVDLSTSRSPIARIDPSDPVPTGNVTAGGTTVPFVDGDATLALLPGPYSTWTNYSMGPNEYLGSCIVPSSLLLPPPTLRVDGIAHGCAIAYGGPTAFTVGFGEQGLPAGTRWSVSVNGTTGTNVTSGPGGVVFFSEPNGTFAYSIADVAGWHESTLPYSGTITVRGFNLFEPYAAYSRVTYTVLIQASGLPAGVAWSLTIAGVTYSITANSTLLAEPNGTYPFVIGPVPGYWARPSSGTAVVAGAPVRQTISFAAIPSGSYPVTFTETGLGPGTNWSVAVQGVTSSSTGSTIILVEANGSYAYAVGSVPGYFATPSSGALRIRGSPLGVSITFVPLPTGSYVVTLTESGLPAGTNWSVTLAGASQSSTGATITFQEPNGTYAFLVGPVSGYTAIPSTGNLTVSGSSVSEALTFSPSSSSSRPSSGFLGLSGNTGYYLLGGVAILVVAGAAVALALRSRRR